MDNPLLREDNSCATPYAELHAAQRRVSSGNRALWMAAVKQETFMRILLLLALSAFMLAACGKKAPLRPPEQPPEETGA